jgi:hypothetical protein
VSYLPQWKARLAAIVLLGEKAVLKKRGPKCLVCLRVWNNPEQRDEFQIHGEGADWQAALDDCRRRLGK